MPDLLDELRAVLGPEMLVLPPLGDAEAVRHIAELKALPNPTPGQRQFIAELDAAWQRAAEPDMQRR